MNATAATVDAKNALTVTAGRDITIQSGKDVSDLTEHSKQTSKGLLSASSLETHDEVHRTDAVSSQFGGDTVSIPEKSPIHFQRSSSILICILRRSPCAKPDLLNIRLSPF